MIRPQPFRFMPGTASRVVWKAAVRFSAIIVSHFSTGKSSTGATCCIPALLTRMSISPASAIIATICGTSVRSAAEWVAPSSAHNAAICASSPKPLSTTSAPSAASDRAIASPIPLVEPVTSARLPLSN